MTEVSLLLLEENVSLHLIVIVKAQLVIVKSGVPQGSILGPVLFNIYVSDMPQNVDSILLQFADDVKMFRAIKTAQDYFCLQSDIDKLVAWCKLWQLSFNVSKCNLPYGSKFPWSNIFVIFVNFAMITKIFVTKFS